MTSTACIANTTTSRHKYYSRFLLDTMNLKFLRDNVSVLRTIQTLELKPPCFSSHFSTKTSFTLTCHKFAGTYFLWFFSYCNVLVLGTGKFHGDWVTEPEKLDPIQLYNPGAHISLQTLFFNGKNISVRGVEK